MSIIKVDTIVENNKYLEVFTKSDEGIPEDRCRGGLLLFTDSRHSEYN